MRKYIALSVVVLLAVVGFGVWNLWSGGSLAGVIPTPSCVVGSTGANVAVGFTGVKAEQWCTELSAANWWPPSPVRLAGLPGEVRVCKIQVSGASATVEDTGSQFYGQGACRALDVIAAEGGGTSTSTATPNHYVPGLPTCQPNDTTESGCNPP